MLKYIGPFFRMNIISREEICSQLFHLSKEAVKAICLNSKCGIVSSFKSSRKSHSTNDISTLNQFSPLLCVYEKSSPIYVHNKTSYGFDEATFKKNIDPGTNALMTLCLLNLSDYYSHFNKLQRDNNSLNKPYGIICKKQLDFYTSHLRNSEGIFVKKKNISEDNSKGFNLVDKNKDFDFSNQAFMMNAYYLYYLYFNDDPISNDYKEFSTQILDMLYDFKDELYNISFQDGCKVLLALNIYFNYSKLEKAKKIIIDLTDFLINKFQEKDYYASAIDDCCLFAIVLKDSFKHTNIVAFNEKGDEILEKLEELYNGSEGLFMKLTEKKNVKYYSTEICLYFLAILLYSKYKDNTSEGKSALSNLYKKLFVNSGIILSWPAAPTLDEVERYSRLSMHSDDMLDEMFFRMPNLPTPESSGFAPIFIKNTTYSRKKNTFSASKTSFDSNKNMTIFFLLIYHLKDEIIKTMQFDKITLDNYKNEPIDNSTSSEIDDKIE